MHTIHIPDLESLPQAAREFLPFLHKGDIVAFYGAMGAGKTTFVRALCEQLGVTEAVTSPTFALVNEYYSPVMECDVYHFDFYRIHRIEEVYDMGYEDYFYGNGVCVIEWPELIEELLPPDTLRVRIEEQQDGSRLLSVLTAEP